ncbi:acyl transferase domain-containing protein [Aspergillus tetrazonus]
MPFDAILLGSRVMAAQEARTSPAVKELICQTLGVGDEEWEGTYKKPTGGIITVRSEMGEPIHKIATRGVMLSPELDRDIFSLPRDQQKAALLARKEYYIKRLNEDSQKNVRLVDLLYLQHAQQWTDPSFRTLLWDFTRRLEERICPNRPKASAILQDLAQLDQPDRLEKDLFAEYPQARHELITAADADYFVLLSQRRGQKPVPYILALDEDFEYWFKKDSLWQSEHLEAVPGQDIGRVCVLHGPVAAQYTTQPDEPVKSILDGIHGYWVAHLLREQGLAPSIQDSAEEVFPLDIDGFGIEQQEDGVIAIRALSDSISLGQWLNALSRASSVPWCCAMFTEALIVQDGILTENPVYGLFRSTSQRSRIAQLRNSQSSEALEILIQEVKTENIEFCLMASASLRRDYETGDILLMLYNYTSCVRDCAIPLQLQFKYKPQPGVPSIRALTTDRNAQIKKYYQTIWVGGQSLVSSSTSDRTFRGGDIIPTRDMIEQFAQSICNYNPKYTSKAYGLLYAPLDLAIAVAWKPLMICLFHPCTSIRKGVGRVVEAEGVLYRNDAPVVRLKSAFILLGEYADYENTFAIESEKLRVRLSSNKHVALLNARRWLSLNDNVDFHEYLGKTIEFEIRSRYRFRESEGYAYLAVEGSVMYQPPAAPTRVLGSIDVSGHLYTKNQITDYLRRHGTQVDGPPGSQPLPESVALIEDLQITIPDSAEQYAQASGDCNPIHLSELFASYANHDTRVTHGMFTSGTVRALVEKHIAQSDPSRMRSWSCTFEGKVAPGDTLSIKVDHVGMSNGSLVLAIQAYIVSSGSKVLSAHCVVGQPLMAYVFTGQGSQQPGMGMELRKQSAGAREVWQTANKYFESTYGFSISGIVRDNPKTLAVHFGGLNGRAIRNSYISLKFHTTSDSGTVVSKRVFPDITPTSRSYTFRSTTGLLHQIQFTQPALALMEIAQIHDMRAKGVIKEDSLFAGHSLGEYVALAAIGKIFTVEKVAALVFYHGLTMQNVNPSRISKSFTEQDLHWCVDKITQATRGLLEIVNYNVANMEYVCAGDVSDD